MLKRHRKTIDPLFAQAARLIIDRQQGSSSILQRELKIGYNKAGMLMGLLETLGIVGSFNGSNRREVLVQENDTLEQFLSNDMSIKSLNRSLKIEEHKVASIFPATNRKL